MKNNQLLIILLCLPNSIFAWNCDDWRAELTVTDAVRRIVNTTDHDLNIKIYGDIGDTLRYEIESNATLDIKGKCASEAGDEYCEIGWMSIGYGSITFNNERIQRFELDNPLGCNGKAINGSVWENCGYKLIEDTETLLIFEYQVTDTDYHNAEIL